MREDGGGALIAEFALTEGTASLFPFVLEKQLAIKGKKIDD